MRRASCSIVNGSASPRNAKSRIGRRTGTDASSRPRGTCTTTGVRERSARRCSRGGCSRGRTYSSSTRCSLWTWRTTLTGTRHTGALTPVYRLAHAHPIFLCRVVIYVQPNPVRTRDKLRKLIVRTSSFHHADLPLSHTATDHAHHARATRRARAPPGLGIAPCTAAQVLPCADLRDPLGRPAHAPHVARRVVRAALPRRVAAPGQRVERRRRRGVGRRAAGGGGDVHAGAGAPGAAADGGVAGGVWGAGGQRGGCIAIGLVRMSLGDFERAFSMVVALSICI